VPEFVKVNDLRERLKLEVIYGSPKAFEREITSSDVSRPGLELTGYFDYFSEDRIQMIGRKEMSFIKQIEPVESLTNLHKIFSKEPPAFVIARSLDYDQKIVEIAQKFDVAILRSAVGTSRLIGTISNFLDDRLAKRTSVHGVLMDVYGVGVLIQGDSGIGKSETGLELIKRGHRLIADDRVDVHQKDELTVVGEPPEILENLLEIRGLGIIDVMNLFGAGAVRTSMPIQMTIYLEQWSKDKQYDRLGSEMVEVNIAGVNIPQIKIPVKTGRNVSIIIEVAAMNYRAKIMGFDATKTLEERLDQLIKKNSHNSHG